MVLQIDGADFKDEHGRTRLLRGVSVAGSSRVPATPDGATHRVDHFYNHQQVSFVGRPFPLEQAERHFERLHHWGLRCLRVVIPWEAIEHDGPGQYDTAYLDYVSALLEKAAAHEMIAIIDPHQEVWSRFTGGAGAPGWTLDKVGFEMRNFQAVGAALVHQVQGESYPHAQWRSNYSKLATATMFALFFGGEVFAPRTTIDGINAQEFLQSHYVRAFQQVAQRVQEMPHVIGFGVMNAPSRGFIECSDLARMDARLRNGQLPTPFQAMLLGEGYPQDVDVWKISMMGQSQTHSVHLDPGGIRAWQEGVECIWRQNGVWGVDDVGNPVLLNPFHFSQANGRAVHFADDFLRPFINRFAAGIREVKPEAAIFIDVEADAIAPKESPHWSANDAAKIVYAPHWYDSLLSFTKQYTPWIGFHADSLRLVIGQERKRRSFVEQLARHKETAKTHFQNAPTLISATGIPFDLAQKRAYASGDFSEQIAAMDDSLQAIEHNLLHAIIWNYTPDNRNAWGDLWNNEDYSIFSKDQQQNPDNLDSGGRALRAVVRPYALATAGQPLRMDFDIHSGIFQYVFRGDDGIEEPTIFYVPNAQYPEGYSVQIHHGRFEVDTEAQRVYFWHKKINVPHMVTIRPAITREPTVPDRPLRNILLLLLGLIASAFYFQWRGKRRQHQHKPDRRV